MNEEIIKLITNQIINHYKDDISLFCIYGSYVTGNMHAKSDVDFFFVPKSDRGKELARTFIINDIGYDLWYLSWERLNRIASFDDLLTPLVAEAQVLWASSKNDRDRFINLQNQIYKTVDSPIDIKIFYKAEDEIDKAKEFFANLTLSSDVEIKMITGNILLCVCNAIMLANNKYFKYGIKKHYEELSKLENLPNDFSELYNFIINVNNYNDAVKFSRRLINSTIKLLNNLKPTIKSNINGTLNGLYEEIISTFNKIYYACDSKNFSLAYISGIYLQNEINALASGYGIKPIIFLNNFDSKNLDKFKNQIKETEKWLLLLLDENNISINKFNSIEDLKQNLFPEK